MPELNTNTEVLNTKHGLPKWSDSIYDCPYTKQVSPDDVCVYYTERGLREAIDRHGYKVGSKEIVYVGGVEVVRSKGVMYITLPAGDITVTSDGVMITADDREVWVEVSNRIVGYVHLPTIQHNAYAKPKSILSVIPYQTLFNIVMFNNGLSRLKPAIVFNDLHPVIYLGKQILLLPDRSIEIMDIKLDKSIMVLEGESLGVNEQSGYFTVIGNDASEQTDLLEVSSHTYNLQQYY